VRPVERRTNEESIRMHKKNGVRPWKTPKGEENNKIAKEHVREKAGEQVYLKGEPRSRACYISFQHGKDISEARPDKRGILSGIK